MKKRRCGNFHLRGAEIQSKQTAKYLGVVFDRHLAFGHHVQEVCAKAERVASALSKVLLNVGGPIAGKRKVMAGIVNSVLLYAAPVWRRALQMDRATIRREQRTMTLDK